MRRKVRTFVALEVSRQVIARAVELVREWEAFGAPVRWANPQQLHITLAFLGDVESLEIPEVCAAVHDAVHHLPPFEWEVYGIGAFPNLERPRTIWLGAGHGCDDVIALHAAVDQGLGKLGFRGEHRQYRPHLTLGRVRSGPDPALRALCQRLDEQQETHIGISDATEVIVFSSELERGGPNYEPLSTVTLDGR